jgi:heptosyltransferase III
VESKKKIAVVPGQGLGDSLIMMIAAHQFFLQGYSVVHFTDHLQSLGQWLPHISFQKHPYSDEIEKTFYDFDTIVLHHDNTPLSCKIYGLKKKGKKVFSFYNNYKEEKHPPLDSHFDFAFSNRKSMAECVAESCAKIFDLPFPSLEIGMAIPRELTFRKNPKKILLNPTSGNPLKNWPQKKYVRLAKVLMQKGYSCTFVVSPKERSEWMFSLDLGIDLPLLPSLSNLAALIYEAGFFIGNDSGPGHLASYLQLPHLILAQRKASITHWRPGWYRGKLLLPPSWPPNFKGMRLRDRYWQMFLSVSKVLNTFKEYETSLQV